MGRMKDRMLRGELYIADDPALAVDAARAEALLERMMLDVAPIAIGAACQIGTRVLREIGDADRIDVPDR